MHIMHLLSYGAANSSFIRHSTYNLIIMTKEFSLEYTIGGAEVNGG